MASPCLPYRTHGLGRQTGSKPYMADDSNTREYPRSQIPCFDTYARIMYFVCTACFFVLHWVAKSHASLFNEVLIKQTIKNKGNDGYFY